MYEYATGLIRVLEKRLLDKNDLERMVLAGDANHAFNVLNDTDFAHFILDRKPQQYDDILQESSTELKNLLTSLLGKNHPLCHFLFLNSHFILIKKELKRLFLNIQMESEAAEIQLHPFLKESISTIIKKLTAKKEVTSRNIESLCDQELFALKIRLAKAIGSRFIHDLIQLQVDFANTTLLLRLLEEKKDGHSVNECTEEDFITGGRLGTEKLLHIYKADKPILFDNLKEVMELYEITHVIEHFKTHDELPRVEKDLNSFEYHFTQTRGKSSSYGPAVVVSYYMNKVNSMRNVRLIMSGKLNGVSTEEIKERIII